MNKLVELKNKFKKIKEEYLLIKVELERYENSLFYEWKRDNPKSRDAKDKVMISLLMGDKKLKEITEEYNEVKIKYEITKVDFDFMMRLLERNDLVIDDINKAI